jgi:small subunit ribosomal protein S6
VRDYEVVYIFDSVLTEDQVTQKLDRYHELLTGKGSGDITAVDHWGKRQLAYPIAKKANGYYAVVQFNADPDTLPEFERILKLDDELLRYIVVLNEGQPTAAMSIASRDPRPDREDGDDEEDE